MFLIIAIFKKLDFIISFFCIKTIRSWFWTQNINKLETTNWKKISKNNFYINPNNENKLFLKTSSFNRKGWFLFGIKHKGNNNKCFGIFKSGQFGYMQSRPMYPIRRRWRVVRIKKNTTLYLTLNNISEPILLSEIWLIPLLPFDAIRRATNRCKKINEYFKINYFSKRYKIFIWKKYNFYLNSQSNNSEFLISYKDWIEIVERKKLLLLNAFLLKNKTIDENNFKVIDADNPTYIKNYSFCIPLKKSDLLSKDNFNVYRYALKIFPNSKVLYTDEDFINDKNDRMLPNFKPAWNREFQISNPFFGSSWLIRTELWNSALNNLDKLNIKPNLQLILLEIFKDLEILNQTKFILHIPLICYHQNILNKNINNESFLKEHGYKLLNHLKRNKEIYGNCTSLEPSLNKKGFRLYWSIPKDIKLSIIIPIRDKVELLKTCLDSIEKSNTSLPLEIIIANNDSKENKTKKFLKKFEDSSSTKIEKKCFDFNGPFNYSRINNEAIKKSSGDVILLLNNDVEFISKDWANELCSNALRPNIGFVGAKLIFQDKTIQHAGVVLGIGGIAGHSHKYFNLNNNGYQNRLDLAQEYSALTAACLAISRKNWIRIGGFDEKYFEINYNDVDICLRANKIGLKNIFLPYVLAFHYESKTRGRPEGKSFRIWKKEFQNMKKIWGKFLLNDPAYNPNLSLDSEGFKLGLNNNNDHINLRSGDLFENY